MPALFAVADGTAYRFDLPTISPPDGEKDRCNIDVFYVADSHAHLLATNKELCQHLLGPHQLFGGMLASRIIVGDTLWLFPGLRKSDQKTVAQSQLRAERYQLAPCNSRTPDSSDYDRGSGRSKWRSRSRWTWGDPSAFAERSWAAPPQGYGPLTSRTSKDPNIVANFPRYPHDTDGSAEDYKELTIEHELPINVALKRPINFTRYVDKLPGGDTFPPSSKLLDRRLTRNQLWCVRQDKATYYRATRMDPRLRIQTWQLLITPEAGLPCKIDSEEVVHFTLAGMDASASVKDSNLKKGRGVLKLVPIGDDYACQPRSAWPEASYLFNHWRIIVERKGRQHDLYAPLAEALESESASHRKDKILLDQLAEIASAEGAPGHITYAKMPYWDSEELSGVGVRLRDGGSRFHLEASEPLSISLPFDPHLLSRWGRFDGKNPEPRYTTPTPTLVTLNVSLPRGPHDVILRVNESDIGDYKRLEYVLRPRGSFKSIKADEWLTVDKTILDEWVICFFVNLAKVTWGCLNRDLIRPSSTPSTVAPATSTAPAEAAGSPASTSETREGKRPRLS